MKRYSSSVFIGNFLILFLTLAACTKVKFHPLDTTGSYKPTSELKMFRNYPTEPYIVLGTFRAVGPHKDKLLKSIRERALKIGAQALVVKPIAERSNKYTGQRQSREFSKVEYIMEAEAIRFKPKEN